MRMKIKKLKEGAHLLQRATEGSAGIDLCALCEEDIVLAAGQRALVPTGLAIELPGAQYVALVFARSGLALREGLAMANGVGVIDSDYRGEVAVPVINQSDKEIHIANGQRIAQMLVMPVELPQLVLVDELSDTERGEGGFGSTGKG